MTAGDRSLRPTGRRAKLTKHVAPGVHRLEQGAVNVYLIEQAGAITLVDAGLPALWAPLELALHALGRSRADVRALVLTHAHFDHIGIARRLRDEWRLPIWGHPIEQPIATRPYSYAHEDPRLLYPLQHPRGLPILARMVASGALAVPGVDDLLPLTAGETLDVPGRPTVVFTPGHTYGHCALHLPESDALLTGDALVTLDPYNARTGPRIVAGAATADTAQALDSLDAVAATGARVLLPGHGEPWKQGAEAAVRHARSAIVD
jgi:glyoxylase-like metal-dependent hydrolase (beta-lactamase superfamily II)